MVIDASEVAMTLMRTDLGADWTFGLFPLTPVNQIVTAPNDDGWRRIYTA
jgi:hypothetical protein